MSTKIKKYFFILALIGFSYGTYWFFYNSHWGVIIDKEHYWNYSFQSKENAFLNTINWSKSKKEIILSEENRSQNLIFQTKFNLKDYTKIIEGVLEYDFRYSAKILINGVLYAEIDRTLISSSLEVHKIKINEYWRPRKVKLNYGFLSQHLKNGENTITLIIGNVEDIKSIKCSKKQLSFLTKGQSNNLTSNFKINKPNNYFSESKLPILKINTSNNFIPDDPKIKASLSIINNPSGVNNFLNPSIFHNIKIERRGNTSQTFAKKSYSFNVYNSSYNKKSIPILDLPSSTKWVLYGPYADKSLIRNALTYSIYRQMGNYAPRTQFIDLIVNDNYQGIYVLTEKIQISPNHLNIHPLKFNKNDSAHFEGGYILEIDRSEWKSIYPPKEDTSSIPVSYIVYAPKKKKISANVQDIIKHQYNDFEQHIYENDSIYNYVDINSFIDYLILTEFTKNIDGYCLSTFLYNKNIKKEIPKFYIGPIWDYNFSLGLTNYHNGYNPEGYVYNSNKYIPFWWKILLNDEKFKSTLKTRYFELRKTSLSIDNIYNTIDSLAKICKSSSDLNFSKWPVLNSPDFWPNHFLGKTYKDEIDYLKSWIKKRLYFLDNDILVEEKREKMYYEISIRNNKEWMKKINVKAKIRNVSIDKMIIIDAHHMAKKE
ncbi:MAG: hypothetical protein COA97_03270 [Flavobacteriales bacterium]|nr:MAG: hypothetical protein COA97_03270 [Flavobacteriales bacterium]